MENGKKYTCSISFDLTGRYYFCTAEDLRLAEPRIERALHGELIFAHIVTPAFIDLAVFNDTVSSDKRYSCEISLFVMGAMEFETVDDLLRVKERLAQGLLEVMFVSEIASLTFRDIACVDETTEALTHEDGSGQQQ